MWKTITINNDHKEKYQSFTARIEFDHKLCSKYNRDGFSIETWGATEEEAFENLRTALREFNEELVGQIDFTRIQYVNGLGKPVTKDW